MHSTLHRITTIAALASLGACSSGGSSMSSSPSPMQAGNADMSWMAAIPAPNPDPRVGLKAGEFNAAEAAWNMRVLSRTQPSAKFLHSTMSDLAFKGNYVIQGSYNGYQIWDIRNPSQPGLVVANYCPASQSDVSVYQNLLFVSSEGTTGRIDCGDQGVKERISNERIRGIRIFDISDLAHPRNVANVQTCRGSHTHTVLVDPKDKDNIYVYVSGSAGIRDSSEMHGCIAKADDPNTAQFRIEVIRVPLAHPEQAAIVSSPRIFNDLAHVKSHGLTAQERVDQQKTLDAAKARGAFTADILGNTQVMPDAFAKAQLDSIAKLNGRTSITSADSAQLRRDMPQLISRLLGGAGGTTPANTPGVTQCHDITVYPWAGLAGGACEGYGLLIDIRNPTAPVRLDAASDTNFSYWHSATFNNDGTKVLFSDEWGGGGAPKCRASDPKEWGSDAIFTIENGKLHFQSYYKMPAAQTSLENCVAHNGSLIPIPGRDVMIQAWYQGGLSVFDWTDAKHPREIAFFDRGPVDSTRFAMGGSWSVYYYNGAIVSSEIARGLDILELTPSPFLSQNEIDAAKTVHMDYMNTQGQPHFVWPATTVLAKAYVDQLERTHGLSADRIASLRSTLNGSDRSAFRSAADQIEREASGADAAKVRLLASTLRAIQ
jgi:hypothetical protein